MSTVHSERRAFEHHAGMMLALTYLAACFLALLPILIVEIPPLVDYPNHLARIHILANYDFEPLLRQNYLVEWHWIPNLAIDGFAAVLTPFLSPMLVGRAFLGLTVLLTAGGIIALHKALFGRVGYWSLLAFAAAYSLPLTWGLVNFQFSIGLSLLCTAAWIACDRAPPHPSIRIIAFNLAAALIYFAHLFGYAALVITIGLYELGGMIRRRDRLSANLVRRFGLVATSFALPAVFLLFGLMDGSDDSLHTLPLGTWQGDVLSKALALLSAFLFYGGTPDVYLILLVLLYVAGAAVTSGLRVAPALRWPLAGMFALTLAAPSIFHGLFLDGRLGFVLGCLFLAATQPTTPGLSARIAFRLLLIGVLVLKTVSIVQIWQDREREYTAFRETLRPVEPGSRILAVHDNGNTETDFDDTVRWYMAAPAISSDSQKYAWSNIETLAAIDRQAYSPVVFKNPASQPLRSAPGLGEIDPVIGARRVTTALFVAGSLPEQAEKIRRQAAEHGEVAFWAGWQKTFDYIVVIRYPRVAATRLDGLPLTLVSPPNGRFLLYRVKRAG